MDRPFGLWLHRLSFFPCIRGLLRICRFRHFRLQVLRPQMSPDIHKMLIIPRRYRSGEIETLHDITAQILEGHHLLFRLHTLCDDRDTQVIGNIDDHLQHAGILLVFKSASDKLHVQLQGVDGQGGDHI